MQPARLSILHRPVKEPSKATETSAERQYEAEQERLRAKAQRNNATHDRLMRSLYPTHDDKLAQLHDVQEHMQQQALIKMQQRQQAAEWDSKYASGMDGSRGSGTAQVLAVAYDRPWLNPSMAYGSDAEEKLARRGHEEEVAATNRQRMRDASVQRSLAEQAELQSERQALQAPTFWNMPHNPRLPAGFTVPTPTAHQPAPAPWADHSVRAAGLPSSASGGGALGKLQAPYATSADLAAPAHTDHHQPTSGAYQQYLHEPVGGPAAAGTLGLQSLSSSSKAPPPFAMWEGPVERPRLAEGPAPPQQAAGLRYAARPPSSQATPWATHEGALALHHEGLTRPHAQQHQQPWAALTTTASGYGAPTGCPAVAPVRAQAPPSSMGQLLGFSALHEGGQQQPPWTPKSQAPDFCWSWKP